MCNNYERRIGYAAYQRALREAGLAAASAQGEHDLPPADNVRIGDIAPVVRLAGDAIELAPMRFGFPPPRPKAGPVFNFRSEGRRFDQSNRCIIPASAFFEFTGTKYPKSKHCFTLAGQSFMGIAGLWRPGEGNQPPAFAMLTVDPGPDVAPYHSRQIVVLPADDWGAWLRLSRAEGEMLRASPAGSLAVETVR